MSERAFTLLNERYKWNRGKFPTERDFIIWMRGQISRKVLSCSGSLLWFAYNEILEELGETVQFTSRIDL